MSAAVASGPEGNEAKSGDAQLKPDSTKLARVPGSPIDLLYQSGFASLLSSTNQAGSIFTLDPKENRTLEAFDVVARANNETFLTRVTLYEKQKQSQWVIVLTDKHLYKYEVDAPLNLPRKRKPLIDFHSVEADTSDPRMFCTRIYKDSVKSNVKSSLFKFIGNLGSKVEVDSLIQVREYLCATELQRNQLVWLLSRLIRDQWQSLLETSVIPEPHYYQYHAFVMKINRKGAHQERVIVISDDTIYNVDISHNPMKVQDVKWGIPIVCLTAVSLEPGCQAKFYFDVDLIRAFNARRRTNIEVKSTDSYVFQFRDEGSRAHMLTVIRYLHHKCSHEDAVIVAAARDSSGANTAGSSSGQPREVLARLQLLSVPQPNQPPQPMQMPPIPYAFAHEKSVERTQLRQITMDAVARATGSQPVESKSDDTSVHLPVTSVLPLPSSPSSISASPSSVEGGLGGTLSDIEDVSKALLTDPLDKLVKGITGFKAHTKVFALFPNAIIRWGDSDKKFKYDAQVLGIIGASDVSSELPPEKRFRFFALRTNVKPLWLIAPDIETKNTWLTFVDSVLAKASATLSVNANPALSSSSTTLSQPLSNPSSTASSSLLASTSSSSAASTTPGVSGATSHPQLPVQNLGVMQSAPIIKGFMTKYIKGGRDKHQKFFCVYANGVIKWGESEYNLKHTSVVVDIDQDLSDFGDKIAREDAVKFLRIKTQAKTLELLTTSQESADRWMLVINRMLGREDEYEDVDED